MTGRRRVHGVVLVLSGLALAGASGTVEGTRPPCVEVWPEARYRNYGYDHIVHIANRCSAAALCQVSTDSNPRPWEATVPPREQVEILVFRGSPAREFRARADCRPLE